MIFIYEVTLSNKLLQRIEDDATDITDYMNSLRVQDRRIMGQVDSVPLNMFLFLDYDNFCFCHNHFSIFRKFIVNNVTYRIVYQNCDNIYDCVV